MLDLSKRFRNVKTKNTNSLLPFFSASREGNNNITLYNKYNDLQNKENTGITDTSLNKKEKIGEARHYTPATKEWVNSTYSYNKNYIKTLPIADDIVNNLIKGYLNMNPLVNNKKSKRVVIRFKRLSLNNTLVSKAEMKHTNNKVIVTIYLYNRNKKFFLYKLMNLYKGSVLSLKNKKRVLNKNKKTLNKNKKILLNKKGPDGLGLKSNYLKRKVKFISLRAVKLIKKIKKQKNLLLTTLYWDNSNLLNYKNKYYKNLIKNAYEIELLYMYYTKMLSLNNNKFKNWFLLGLKKAVSKLYNKKVEFNFVSLKYLHLNSDIFTQSIVTRIRNRQNSLRTVLNKAFKLAKIPQTNRNINHNTLNDNAINVYNKHKSYPFITNVALEKRELNVSLALGEKNKVNDVLHLLLNNIFNPSGEKSQNKIFFSSLKAKKLNNKQINVLDSIKYKNVLGVRLEAAGRLSKRLTASRSLFKLKYKGGLKNVESSNVDFSSVMLRGNVNSNVQYTIINNKTRNGSFGLKGWINGY